MTEKMKTLSAEEVIEKFGGLRPLANRLGIAASTVQGWKERGVVPENRIADVLEAAAKDGIILTGEAPVTAAPKAESRFTRPAGAADDRRETERKDRRQNDRRQRQDPDFAGPDRRVDDRRSGIDRREKRAAEWVHKKRFLERWMLTASILFFLIVLVGVFLLAPEYRGLQERAAKYEQMQTQLAEMNDRLDSIAAQRGSISGRINEGLSKLEQAKDEVVSQIESAEQLAAEFASGNWQQQFSLAEQKIFGLSTMMDRVDNLLATPGGGVALQNSLAMLKSAVGSGAAPADTESLNQLRENDPILASVMKGVRPEDVEAAVMLLTLNQVRGAVGSGAAPFEQDIALLRELNKDDPETLAAIERLAPYAKSGILSGDRLSAEFKALAGEIVMAKLRGEDASVRDRAMARLSKLMTVRRVDQLEGDSEDAIVARAQLKLEQNDVQGAIAELQKLQGASAEVAAPFMQQAQLRASADMAVSNLTQTIMTDVMAGQNLSPTGIKDMIRTLLGRGGGVSAAVVSGQGNGRQTGDIGAGNTAYPGLTVQ